MDLLRQIFDAGVVGAGGAGFPTHRKLNCRVEYLIINGAECEPILSTDQYLMRNKSSQLVAAAVLAAKQTGACHVIFAIKKKYVREARALKEAIEKTNSQVELFFLEGIYPAGDEQMLVYEITGKTVEPGGIPLGVGAVVSNINTIFNIYEAANNKPVTSRYITVAGEVGKPTLVKAPLGTSVIECIEAAGGVNTDKYKVIMGGPMMGKFLGIKQLGERYVTKTDSGIIVIPENHYLANRDSAPMEHIINQAKSVCIQCSYCTDMCPRYLIGHRLRPHRIMRGMAAGEVNDEVYAEALICSECGICELYACPMGLSPRKVNIYLKGVLRVKGIRFTDKRINPLNSAMREFRNIPLERLISRIDMAKYNLETDDEVVELQPEKVCIPLKQHIGVPSSPVVSRGEEVGIGQLIAAADYDGSGANIHAGIKGMIEEVSSTHIKINSAGLR